jgi:fido (protein-threonine AMPylation protein)
MDECAGLDPQMLADIHQDLFARLPLADLEAGALGDDAIEPGRWRTRRLAWAGMRRLQRGSCHFFWTAGRFYSACAVASCSWWAMAAAHQRLAWIHPFREQRAWPGCIHISY